MNAEEFIEYWENKTDHDGSKAVGIHIDWPKISLQSQVNHYFGKQAWEKIGEFYPPWWGGFNRTKLKGWLYGKRRDYKKFIDEERAQGKIDLYDKKGLVYPEFCAFTDEAGLKGILGDGSHRYIDCNYLILQGRNLSEDISKCRLDIIRISNLNEVLSIDDFLVLI